MKTLVIAAHPDDEVLGCGGYIKKYNNSQEIEVLILTNGCSTRYDSSMIESLKTYALKANKHLGNHKLFFEDLPNQGLDAIPLTQVIHIIEKHIERFKPDRVLTHHYSDLNLDHQIVYQASLTASRPLSSISVKELLCYYTPSSTEWNQVGNTNRFEMNWIIDIENELDFKLKAMKEYYSELRPFPHPRSIEALDIYAKFFGINHGLSAAEPFQLIRKILE